ncbi:MAG: murein L,D-transpeptidase [Candidatus Adiutrix sp.]|nr:murein L,D-transpeptidase [Candidatus Adiutrix sp.]
MAVAALAMFFASLAFLPIPALAAGREEAAAAAARPRLEKKLAGLKAQAGAPVFLRIFKEESTLEVWLKPKGAGRYILFKSYPICAWSGSLGPKTKEGDRQAPEGFYAVGLKHLNPYSSYHLSFDLGYPNAYDKAQGYTGNLLMVHGDCRSDGCYAMTNSGIEEIYTLVKAALDNGQPFFRVHCFPFRLTPQNLERHKNKTWRGFWRTLEPVYTYFETNHLPPEVAVESGRYRISGAGQ